MKRIGIIEDDGVLAGELKYFLDANGYDAQIVEQNRWQAASVAESGYHLLLLDIGLPDTDGLHLCREIRRICELPVIMITSRNTELTELTSMNNGADDFVSKPFHPQILLARMEAILKRVYREHQPCESIELEGFTLDISKGRIQNSSGMVELTKNEMKMLAVLSAKRGSIVSRDEIINALWDDKMFVDDNTLTVNMTRLKGKLEGIDIHGAIVTKRGIGYQLL